MQPARERRLQARERVTRLEQGNVKGLAVEGDDSLVGVKDLRQPCQRRPLIRVVAQEELPHHELRALDSSDADQKRTGAGPACQAGGFGVQVDQSRRLRQFRSVEEQAQRAQVGHGNVADAESAVGPAEGECLTRQKEFAGEISLHLTFDVLLDAFGSSMGWQSFPSRLQPAQIFELAGQFLVARRRLRGFLELAKFLFQVHSVVTCQSSVVRCPWFLVLRSWSLLLAVPSPDGQDRE